ncbi:hypothetical protein CAURIS_09940 [Corynebacterium auris]|nr:hypothetical protein CAURIS_09940 [Corynebacterium auris]
MYLYTRYRRKAVLTGPAALRLMGVKTLSWVDSIDLVLEGTTRAKSRALWPQGVVYRSGMLTPQHVRERGSVMMTSLAMALFDTYRYYGRAEALVAVESALQINGVEKGELLRWVAVLPRAKTIRQFRELVEYASPLSESPLETQARDNILVAEIPGLVKLEQQVPFRYVTSWGEPKVGRHDMVINDVVVVEADGKSKWADDWKGVTREERERERWAMHGDKVLIRASWDDVSNGNLVRWVREAIALTQAQNQVAGRTLLAMSTRA